MSMFECPDHPDLVSIMQTGYPRGHVTETPHCQECGRPLYEDMYEDATHEYLCRECLLFFHRKDY